MYYEKDSGITKFVAGMLVGAVLGAGVALLSAPDSGRATRTRIVRRVRRSHDHENDQDQGGDEDDESGERDEIVATLKRRRRKARR